MKPWRKQFGIWVPDRSLSDKRGFINAGAVGAIAGSRRRSGDADVSAYLAARTSITSSTEINAVTALVSSLKSNGLWNGIAVLVPLCMGSFSDLFTALKGPTPSNGNFVSGDFTSTGATLGLVGNGSSKYINTNYSNSSISLNDFQAAIYVSNFPTSKAAGDLIWGRAAATTAAIYPDYSGTAYAFSGVGTSISAPKTANLYQCSRTSSTRIDLYINGSSVANSTTSNSGSLTAGESGLVFAVRSGSGTIGVEYSTKRNALYCAGASMNSTQAANFATAVNTFIAALA